jgi:hypothetical protein
MIDAQSSALARHSLWRRGVAAQIGIGSTRATRVIRDALVVNAEVRRGGASNRTRGRVRSPSTVILSGYLCGSLSIYGPDPALPSKSLSQKVKICSSRSSTLLKVNKGYFREKNSEFFSGLFHWKSLANHRKIAQKTAQICSKNTRFLMCFQSALTNQSARPKKDRWQPATFCHVEAARCAETIWRRQRRRVNAQPSTSRLADGAAIIFNF